MLIICESMPITRMKVVSILRILRIWVAEEVPDMLLVGYSTTRITAPNLKGLI